jgi:transcriptional regulator with XRE-family HTH domain
MGNLQMSPAKLARALEYSNSATLSKVQRGEAFVDVERLYRLAQLEAPDGQKIDLHWLITGKQYSEENKA